MDAWGQLSVQASSQQSVDDVVEHIYIDIYMYIWRFCLSNIKVSSLVLFIQTLWAFFKMFGISLVSIFYRLFAGSEYECANIMFSGPRPTCVTLHTRITKLSQCVCSLSDSSTIGVAVRQGRHQYLDIKMVCSGQGAAGC